MTDAVTCCLRAHTALSAGLGGESSLAQVELVGEAAEVGGELASVVVGPAAVSWSKAWRCHWRELASSAWPWGVRVRTVRRRSRGLVARL